MAGKSTLAAHLFKLIPEVTGRSVMIRHFTKPPKEFDKYWNYASCVQRDVIIDRLHLSQLVYRHVDGESHDLTPLKYELVDALISQVGGIVVVLCPPDDVVRKRWTTQPAERQEMYSLEHALLVNQVYRELAEAGKIDAILGTYRPKVDWTFLGDFDVDLLASAVTNLWRQRQRQLDEIIAKRPGRVI